MERSIIIRMEKAVRFRFYGFFIGMFLLAGCVMQDENPIPAKYDASTEFSDAQAKIINVPDEIIHFEGFLLMKLVEVKEHETYFDFAVPILGATLEHVNGNNYILRVLENGRDLAFITTMTPSGTLECLWPVPSVNIDPITGTEFDNPVDQLEFTTGLKLHGPGINKKTLIYKGKFDGEKLFISTHFTGNQETFGTNPRFQVEIKGSMQFTFGYDLTVVDN